ncbi:hypothetical protein Pint_04542 [Pistacia integerrima]|uniref:Uncharacterized protein n=1 Tax=Pistacia integerrima TaxID=434235 RepID=A0ACC0ZAT6_9ROSI|nr:hypothetical protein Pint_04542 [Pistacia integerrima]
MLPQLQELSLLDLPNLTNFCSVGYHFIFPSLKYLCVQDCPKIITRFSYSQMINPCMPKQRQPKQAKKMEVWNSLQRSTYPKQAKKTVVQNSTAWLTGAILISVMYYRHSL